MCIHSSKYCAIFIKYRKFLKGKQDEFTLLHSKLPKLYRVLAVLSVIGLPMLRQVKYTNKMADTTHPYQAASLSGLGFLFIWALPAYFVGLYWL